ncbi:unnamed protein product [Lymnaea stagnalis]|uniref:Mannosyltransferase n=1 Tax=Lymnaea stagnalis TaxID=6523 RepID=A0AAV2H3V3_LYMST
MAMIKPLEACVVLTMIFHLLMCPFTKVEESFNIQAIHDIINYGFDVEKFDHLEFPGVVPRSFLGPLAVAAVASPFVILSNLTGASKLAQQYIGKGTIGLATAVSFIIFCRAVESGFGGSVKNWLLLITITQFHFMFYMSRPLPNVFALILVLLALSSWLYQKHKMFIWLSGASIIIFRFDLVMFLGLIVCSELVAGRLSVIKFIFLMTTYSLPLITGLTMTVDSYFWQRWLWPEGEVMWFNVVLNKSSDWGTSPFLWYFYSVLPRALSLTLVLVPVGVYLMRHVTVLLFPAIGYILLFSLLPHKELRFIIYTFPVFNTVAACAMSALWKNKDKSLLKKLGAMAALCLLLGNAVVTSGFLYIAHHNYPGGTAIKVLHQLEHDTSDVHVHIDVYTAQTGVTRFTQLRQDWIYNKTENLPVGGPDILAYSHLMVGSPDKNSRLLEGYADTHTILAEIVAYDRLVIDKSSFPPVRVLFSEKCYILKKKV